MKRLLFLLLTISLGLNAQTDSLAYLLKQTEWKAQKIAPRAYWQQHHFANAELFNANQNVNILRIKQSHRPLRLNFGSGDQALIPTSTLGQQAGAIAALNGTFFDVKNGGSVDLIRIKGVTLDTTRPSGKFLAEHQRSAVLIKKNRFEIIKGDSIRGWEKILTRENNVMVTGPLLIHEGKKIQLTSRVFNTTRHPRTALGITRKGEILWITVDGRAKEAAGMSLFELQKLMWALGCTSAINLDGGGSTTLWVQGMSKTGVVNMPCDDKVFDEYGERKVSNVLLLSRRKTKTKD